MDLDLGFINFLSHKFLITINALIKFIATTKWTPKMSFYTKNSKMINPHLSNKMGSVLQVGI